MEEISELWCVSLGSWRCSPLRYFCDYFIWRHWIGRVDHLCVISCCSKHGLTVISCDVCASSLHMILRHHNYSSFLLLFLTHHLRRCLLYLSACGILILVVAALVNVGLVFLLFVVVFTRLQSNPLQCPHRLIVVHRVLLLFMSLTNTFITRVSAWFGSFGLLHPRLWFLLLSTIPHLVYYPIPGDALNRK